MEITKSLRDIGSIYGHLDKEHFETIEEWKEVLGVFEVKKLPGELPLITGNLGK